MKHWLASLLLFCLAAPAFAQDDCPPGHVRNDALQPIDAKTNQIDPALMLAHYRASFVGVYGREPTMVDKSGIDDGWYYIRQANHFGVYGDDQCHAGWSGYWESWLRNGHGDLSLVQTAARFQPTLAPPVPPVPPPAPPVQPPSMFSEAAMLAAIQTAHDAEMAAIAVVGQKVDDFREAVRSKWAALVKNPAFQIVVTAISTWAATYVMRKP